MLGSRSRNNWIVHGQPRLEVVLSTFYLGCPNRFIKKIQKIKRYFLFGRSRWKVKKSTFNFDIAYAIVFQDLDPICWSYHSQFSFSKKELLGFRATPAVLFILSLYVQLCTIQQLYLFFQTNSPAVFSIHFLFYLNIFFYFFLSHLNIIFFIHFLLLFSANN